MGACGSSVAPVTDEWANAKLIGENVGKMTVAVCTWNVGNTIPDAEELNEWVPKDGVDMVVIGCQEMEFKVKASKTDDDEKEVTNEDAKKSCEDFMRRILDDHLKGGYQKLTDVELGEMHMFLYVSKQKWHHVSKDFEEDQVVCGIGNIIKNKGATICSLSYLGTRICFVNTHMAAHQQHNARRNEDHARVQRVNNIGCHNVELKWKYDHVIWMGDLNYRLDYGDQGMEPSPSIEQFDKMVELIDNDELDGLLATDQLHSSRAKGESWIGFEEGDIRFKPTFKMQKGKGFAYKNKRSPAWCDRVLWHNRGEDLQGAIRCTYYDAFPKVSTSDHKPVRAHLDINIRTPVAMRVGDTKLRIKFYKLGATDIRVGDDITLAKSESNTRGEKGTSDAYVKFMGWKNGRGPKGIIKGDSRQTHTADATLNPRWNCDKPKVEFEIESNNPAYLEREFLLFAIYDKDTATGDDYLGCGAIPLADAARETGTKCAFEDIQIEYDGKPAGKLYGSFAILQKGASNTSARPSQTIRSYHPPSI